MHELGLRTSNARVGDKHAEEECYADRYAEPSEDLLKAVTT